MRPVRRAPVTGDARARPSDAPAATMRRVLLSILAVRAATFSRPARAPRPRLAPRESVANPAVLEMATVQASKARDYISPAEHPDELGALEALIRDGAAAEQTDVGAKIYELLIKMSLDFQGDAATTTMKRVDTPDVFSKDYPVARPRLFFFFMRVSLCADASPGRASRRR